MEELKQLLELVRDLPHLAVWVLVIIFAYKVAIVGSIYGVLRLAIKMTHDAYMAKTNKQEMYDANGHLRTLCLDHGIASTLGQDILRLARAANKNTTYVDYSTAVKLKRMIDEELKRVPPA